MDDSTVIEGSGPDLAFEPGHRASARGDGGSGRSRPPGAGGSGGRDSMRVPPHNLEAEESLLGAMLLSRDAVGDAIEATGAEEFYRPAHQQAFDAARRLFAAGDPVDAVTVAEELARADGAALEAVGGLDGLMSLAAATPATSNAAVYARIVHENFMLRRLIGATAEIAEVAYGRPTDVAKALDWAEAEIYRVAQDRGSDQAVMVGDLLDATLDRLEELYGSDGGPTGTPTGYIELDKLTSGLQPSSLYVVGARPSMGKTAFALGMVANAGVRHSLPVLLFSLEMGHMELTQRLLSSEARVDSVNMRDGRLGDDDWRRINSALGKLASAPIWIDDSPNVTITQIRARARRLRSKVGALAMVVVDYLQLMTGRSSAENRQVEVSEISRGLKILARELECPVVALSQLSRALEVRADKRPMLADLRESGAIEQDADVVMFIYRDEVYNPSNTDTAGLAEISVAKHRNGPTGLVQLGFVPRFASFQNLSRQNPD